MPLCPVLALSFDVLLRGDKYETEKALLELQVPFMLASGLGLKAQDLIAVKSPHPKRSL